MRLSRRDVGILLSAAAALAAARPASAQGKGKIVYMIPTLLDEFQTESQKAVESVFGSLGYEVTSVDAQNDAARQLSQLEDLINTKPDAVIINAVAFDTIVPGIEKAREAGIKVLNFDRLITSTQFELTSVAGTVEIGEIAAGEAVRLLTERHGSPKGKVLQILGDPGDAYTLDIQKGFEAVMAKEAPEVEIISKAALLWEPTNAGRAFEDQLLVTQDIDLVFCHAAHLTVPIVSIMESKGMKPGEMMLMASNGAPVGLDNIRAGWQQVEVEQPTYAQVYGLAMFIDKIMAGEELQTGSYKVLGLDATLTNEDWGPNLKIPGAAITKENVDDPRFWGNLQFPNVPVDVVK
ncbi:sugar ABC transporter substrate-binding protein [Geminicoccus flavidas]|uniref:sugar ABC transporter substrate-binding protein n=1 Tax=Geminicoccus flavidas TaxID=2506407 RepID=UPI0013571C2A|nr:sugar ABC transporter substrate-binding protein [Geminicoccus flavidas]